jgi:hypothetical protein
MYVIAENARKQRNYTKPSTQLAYEGSITVENMQICLQLAHKTNIATLLAPPHTARPANERVPQCCGNCRVEGHKRNRCPLNNST